MSNSGPVDLTTLVAQAGAGDAEAARAVYDHTIDDAWRIAVSTVRCPVRAGDVIRQAYERVWSSAAAPVSDGGLPLVGSRGWVLAWVYRVGRDAASAAA
ncbi:hypothetical protein [Nocardioides litoris]|uniref:hypothetical protein n=1 Tax=Nocardioides litoris TaxID=1926648 RepID=UPI00111ECC28|nr:hypothetical protein [Nocardioides litoris]